MNKAILLGLALWVAGTQAGQDTRGTEGMRIRLLENLELMSEVTPWDRIQFQEEFRPVDQPAFKEFIEPQIKALKMKLPRLADRIETIIKRGINPRWYFVQVELKKPLEHPQTDLILTFEGVRIASHNGQVVKIYKKLWEKESKVSQAWTLSHEMWRSAVEVMAVQDDALIAMLNSLFMHKDLATFDKKELAKAFLHILRGGPEKEGFFQADTEADRQLFNLRKAVQHHYGPESPLVKLIEADINVVYQSVGEWEDRSTREDGLSGTSCSYRTDQCVFRDRRRGPIFWSEISPAEPSESEGISLEKAKQACSGLKKWGGFSDWRLPSFSELYDIIGRIEKIVHAYPWFGQNNSVFLWSATSPQESSWWMLDPLPKDRGYAISLGQEQDREFEISALNSYRCVRDDYASFWLWDSIAPSTPATVAKTAVDKAAPKHLSDCSQPGGPCYVQSKRSGFFWTGASPNFVPDYGSRRRHDDLGYVSRRKAERTCQALNWGGKKGWRLPTPDDIIEAHADGLFGWSLKHEKFGALVHSFWVKDEDGDPNVFDNGFSFERGRMLKGQFDSPRYPGLRRYICVWDGANRT